MNENQRVNRVKECGELRLVGQKLVRDAVASITSSGCGTQARQIAKRLLLEGPVASEDTLTYAVRAFAEYREKLVELRYKTSAEEQKALAVIRKMEKRGVPVRELI
jgi:hypothetical protein